MGFSQEINFFEQTLDDLREYFWYTLQRNFKHIFPEMKLRGLVPNFYIHVSVSHFCIPMIGPWQTSLGNIYKSLTDT
jgi:hypothetical protein